MILDRKELFINILKEIYDNDILKYKLKNLNKNFTKKEIIEKQLEFIRKAKSILFFFKEIDANFLSEKLNIYVNKIFYVLNANNDKNIFVMDEDEEEEEFNQMMSTMKLIDYLSIRISMLDDYVDKNLNLNYSMQKNIELITNDFTNEIKSYLNIEDNLLIEKTLEVFNFDVILSFVILKRMQ